MNYSVLLLGPMQVLVDDKSVDASFRTKKERGLLAYLIVEGRKQHRRESLSEMFWPGRPEGYARTNLRQALLGLRRVLGDEVLSGGDEYISYGLAKSTRLDTQQFSALLQFTQTHPHRNLISCDACIGNMEEAVGLYRGDFLEDVLLPDSHTFQEWVILHREHYFRLLLSAYRSLSDAYQIQGDYETAHEYAWRYVNSAPLEEAAHRQLIQLLALSGRRSAALEQFHTVREILARELGVEPSAETVELYEKIRDGGSLRIGQVSREPRQSSDTARRPPNAKTGPLNVELFWDRLENTLARAGRHKLIAALILVELKGRTEPALISKTQSRSWIQEAGEHIADTLRNSDTVSYLGGARYGIILDELASPHDILQVINKLLNGLADLTDRNLLDQVNWGLAMYPADGETSTGLYNVAQDNLLKR
jgi:DNA-binding SARP family transcriptional activator